MYLLDTVSIIHLNYDALSSAFVRDNCLVPAEIYYEVSSIGKRNAIERIVEKPSKDLLHTAQKLLKRIGPNNRVLDLYRNEGNGDIMLIATALLKIEIDAMTLFKRQWIIVSDDKELQLLAQNQKLKAISTEAFKERLKATK